jgi:hypothetical protein
MRSHFLAPLAKLIAGGTDIHDNSTIGWIDRCAILYLAIPVLIFFIGWLQPLFGIPLSIVLLLGFAPWLLPGKDKRSVKLPLSLLIWAAAAAVAWTLFGGAGHFFYANTDWLVRDAVLRDLVVSAWPVKYGLSQGMDIILRCPSAYYLPAAALGKFSGLAHADFLLFIWTALGVFLFLVLALSESSTMKQAVIVTIVVIAFSGMDVLGTIFMRLPLPSMPEHLEWWAHFFQYSSNTTQIFWVPNHALPGWIMTALLYRHRKNFQILKVAPMLLAVTPLWAPLVAIGLAPFGIFLMLQAWRRGKLVSNMNIVACICGIVIFVVLAKYVTMDSARIASHWTFGAGADFTPLLRFEYYGTFCLLEFGMLVGLLYVLRRGYALVVITPVLLLLPLYTFGPGNDLAMRASIPALMLICLSSAYAVSEIRSGQITLAQMALAFCLLIGALTPTFEFSRAILLNAWKPSPYRSVVEIREGGEMLSNYIGKTDSPMIRKMLRNP